MFIFGGSGFNDLTEGNRVWLRRLILVNDNTSPNPLPIYWLTLTKLLIWCTIIHPPPFGVEMQLSLPFRQKYCSCHNASSTDSPGVSFLSLCEKDGHIWNHHLSFLRWFGSPAMLNLSPWSVQQKPARLNPEPGCPVARATPLPRGASAASRAATHHTLSSTPSAPHATNR